MTEGRPGGRSQASCSIAARVTSVTSLRMFRQAIALIRAEWRVDKLRRWAASHVQIRATGAKTYFPQYAGPIAE